MKSINPPENFINLSIADVVCRLVFERSELYKNLKKEYPPDKKLLQSPFLKFKMIGKTNFVNNLSRYKIITRGKIKEGIAYYFPPENYTKTLTRNIKFGLSVLIQYFLLDKQILLIHASSTIYKGKAYLFSGQSGAGKSTLISNFPKKNVLSDDITIIRKINGTFYVYSSPFDYKKFPFISQRKVPLAGIFFLQKALKTKIQALNFLEALNLLFYNTNLIYYGSIVNKALKRKKYIRFKKIVSFKTEEKALWGKTLDRIYRLIFNMISVTPSKKLFCAKKLNIKDIFI